MRSSAYRRFMRRFLAALIEAELSLSDMRTLARALQRGELKNDLADLVEQAAYITLSFERGVASSSTLHSPHEEYIFELINRQRLPKAQVFEMMRRSTRGKSRSWVEEKKTLRENLRRFFDQASGDEAGRFMELLDVPRTSDEYLQGIIGK